MTVTDLIASLSKLPPAAIVRVFSTEEQDWMPLTDINHNITSFGECVDLCAYPQDDEDDEDDEKVYTTRDDVVGQVERLLGDGGSRELAERVFDYMREQGQVSHNGTGFVIERDTNVFEIAATMQEI